MSESTNITFRASQTHPCPTCGSPTKGCSATGDGLHFCRGEPRSGWKCVKKGDEFQSYRREDEVRSNPKRTVGKAADWPALARKFAETITQESRKELARHLGLPLGAIETLPLIGLSTDNYGPHWTFPEVDAAGNVVGICRRYSEPVMIWGELKNKLMMKDSRHGIYPAAGWESLHGPVLDPEGASDVLALALCGLSVVGRPSAQGGAEHLAQLFRDLPADRNIIIIGENDRKSDGKHPGREGAESTSAKLGATLGRKVWWSLPPQQFKDSREWVQALVAGAGESPDYHAIGAEILAHLEANAVSILPDSSGITGDKESIPSTPLSPTVCTPKWPDPMERDAFHGLVGRFVEAVEPASEADPVALLIQFLLAVGNAAGRKRYATVEGDRHSLNEFAVIVGRSAKGRKGTSWGRVKATLTNTQKQWATERIMSGLSSGEGVIWNVRDPIDKQEKISQGRGQTPTYETVQADPGVEDKRLMVVEPEFANVLKQTERQGNNLSAILRQSWDGGSLRSMTKNSPAQATDPHISIIGHITDEELKRYLTATETANGFGNRFLWFLTRRSKLLPDGGTPDVQALEEIECELTEVLKFARNAGEIVRDDDARALWREVYPTLSGDRHGLAGSLSGRAEAHTLRLSLIYAVLDRSCIVKPEHLMAALAVWQYAEDSVRCLFGDSTGNPLADEIVTLLRASPGGLTRNEIRDLAGKNLASGRIDHAMNVLMTLKLARFERKPTGGRPSELWVAV